MQSNKAKRATKPPAPARRKRAGKGRKGPPTRVVQADNRRVKGSEMITTVLATGSANFAIDSYYPINPASSQLFPRASQEAKLYQKYKIHKLRLRYEPIVGEYRVNAGNVILCHEPNVMDMVPLDTAGMMQSQDSRIIRVFEGGHLDFPASGVLFTCEDALHLAEDLKTYHFGSLVAAIEGVPTTVLVGERLGYLFIEYDIELIQRQSSNSKYLDRSIFTNVVFTNPTLFSGPATRVPLEPLSLANAPTGWATYTSYTPWYSRMMQAERLASDTTKIFMPSQAVAYNVHLSGVQSVLDGIVTVRIFGSSNGSGYAELKKAQQTVGVNDYAEFDVIGKSRNNNHFYITVETNSGNFTLQQGNLTMEPI